MEAINWLELIPVIIPSLIAVIFAVLSTILKLKKDSMQGMGKEVSELLVAFYDAYKDGKLTQDEIMKILNEGQDVIEEAKKLLANAN